MDVAAYARTICAEPGNSLMFNKHYIILGNEQVNSSLMECEPEWLIRKPLKDEIAGNWKDAYDEVKDFQVPKDANIVTSHVLYKVKIENKEKKRLKARL